MSWTHVIWWCAMVLVTSPIWGSLIWFILESYVRPARIPEAEIEALATQMRRQNPADPLEAAFIEEHAAWHRSDMFEQGKWRRVRKILTEDRAI